jgi:hypothetical protein
LSRFETEIEENAETGIDTRRMTGRVAASLLIAIVAYFGLLLGGNLIVSPARGMNSLSSTGKESQSPQISARDAVRGVLAADRKIAPKYSNYDSGPASLVAPPTAALVSWHLSSPLPVFDLPHHSLEVKPYQPRGPPSPTV